ncbi:extracellular solute-binding protein [Clostridium sp. YIM B02505]|uniref:Extracellular solute-binding protein n=1 Tax=Clostridium yunnanense TaxID=2800325 RepID=A0ABS1EX38_9CLOT|nr:extracellular solute-binding protein [Clostridium yunnanense]MBK1813937.1 extracellular solute-binding protein [Clostridium yunnanense]
MVKKKIFKVLTVGLATVISMSFLVGCGNKKDDKAKETSTTSADQPGWKEDISPVTLDWYVNFSWFTKKWQDDAISKYVTKKTGVTLNLISPAGNEAEKVNTMIASGKLPDILTLDCNDAAIKTMIQGGLVSPLDELAQKYDMYFTKVADQQKLDWYKQEDGHVYEYPNASSSLKDFDKYKDLKPSNQTFLVRKDMYEALGKPDMSTPEGFLNALKAAKEKFGTVNGQPLIPIGLHEFGDTGNYSLNDYIQNFLAIPWEKDGKVYDRQTDPEYITWLKTFRKANEMGLLAKDIFVDKRSQMEEKVAQGRYFAMLYQRSDMASQQLDLYKKDPKSIYIAVDGPKNSKGDQAKLAGDKLGGWTVTLVSKACKDPKRAIRFISYLISEEGNKDLFLGEKGVTYDTIDGKEQFKPEVLKLLNEDRPAFDKKYGASFTYWMLMDTNLQLKWAPPSSEPIKAMEDWTKGKTVSYAVYDQINPKGDNAEGIAQTKLDQLLGATLPKLLMAKSDAEFDTIFAEFKKKRDEAGFDKVVAYRQKQFEENKKKLGVK